MNMYFRGVFLTDKSEDQKYVFWRSILKSSIFYFLFFFKKKKFSNINLFAPCWAGWGLNSSLGFIMVLSKRWKELAALLIGLIYHLFWLISFTFFLYNSVINDILFVDSYFDGCDVTKFSKQLVQQAHLLA